MSETKQILIILSLLCVLGMAGAITCYSCATTSEEGKCVAKWKTLRNSRLSAEAENLYDDNVRNCTEDKQYCKIEKIEARGQLLSYIRGCSDGSSFSLNFRSFTASTDNRSTCIFDQNSAQQFCVTLCSGDFCNGPSSATELTPNMVIFISLLVACLLYKKDIV